MLQEFYVYTGFDNGTTAYEPSPDINDDPVTSPLPACPAAQADRVVEFITIATDALD